MRHHPGPECSHGAEPWTAPNVWSNLAYLIPALVALEVQAPLVAVGFVALAAGSWTMHATRPGSGWEWADHLGMALAFSALAAALAGAAWGLGGWTLAAFGFGFASAWLWRRREATMHGLALTFAAGMPAAFVIDYRLASVGLFLLAWAFAWQGDLVNRQPGGTRAATHWLWHVWSAAGAACLVGCLG